MYHANISIHRRNSLVCPRFVQFTCDQLLQCEDNAIFTSYADRCASVLDRLDGIFYLDLT